MLHTGIVYFYQLVTILIKRIRPKPILKGIQHIMHFFRHILFGFFQVIIQHPIIEIKIAFYTRMYLFKILVMPDIRNDRIITYRVFNTPFITRSTILMFGFIQ